MTLTLLLSTLTACGSGEWIVTAYGEPYIEEEIPAEAFADGCAARFNAFEVEVVEAALLDGDGEAAGELPGARLELTTPGPQELGAVEVPATHYGAARFTIGPAGGDAVRAAGTLQCGEAEVRFDWSFDARTSYLCEPAELTVPAGGQASTELTLHGDHLFYDGLEADDAEVRGQAIVDADSDGDGEVTLSELEAVDVASLGYGVGQYSEVGDLAAFIAHLSRTLGHVDGEGHCQVDL